MTTKRESFILTIRYLNSIFIEGKMTDDQVEELAAFSLGLRSSNSGKNQAAEFDKTFDVYTIIEENEKEKVCRR